jgi:tRNA G18 (ribose-2'-O)-methylase SpoU
VLAIGERREAYPLPSLLAMPGPLLILEDLTNHDNLGGIFRTAAALGGPGCAVLLSPRCADPLYRKALRVSMGHVLGVPFARLAAWPQGLDSVRAAAWRVLALTPEQGAHDLAALEMGTGRVALLLGSEGPGISPGAAARADFAVRIPMRPRPDGTTADSLNVAMAAGIGLYHLGKDG